MKLNVQHIGRLFTFLAGLIIVVHSVVPHHHHFELTHSSELESTCESSSQDKNTETPDSHCYAFNVLVSGKATNASFNNLLSDYFSLYLPGNIAQIEAPSARDLKSAFWGCQATFLKQFFVTAQSLRAPPVTV